MKITLSMIGVLLVAAAVQPIDVGSAARIQQDRLVTRPRLIVMFVVDQMKADYFDVFANRWKSGFATLRRQRAVFDRAEYPYMNTVTCPGHDWHRHLSACSRDDSEWLVGSNAAGPGQLH